MIAKAAEFLFHLSGLIVFWAEIFSTLLGVAAVVYTSWKVYKQLNKGEPDEPVGARALIPDTL